jgi:ribulose-5-phosphate 4-epimerase/fuculose-1-phosphate aldolase
LFVIGKDLDAAFDSVERIDTNAYCILMSRLLPGMADRTPEEIHQELLRDLEHFADA